MKMIFLIPGWNANFKSQAHGVHILKYLVFFFVEILSELIPNIYGY
jgi:hypothetical protein